MRERRTLRDFFKTDTKPRNYGLLTFTINLSITHEGKVEFLKSLEQLILKSISYTPPTEQPVGMDSVTWFEGKHQDKILTVWFSRISPPRKLAAILMKVCKIKLN
ncbi:MAG: hypothetical protein LWY06_20670 [Firmicutes bacterium]|nr:hypothetical protein [Bacillota bacterium]